MRAQESLLFPLPCPVFCSKWGTQVRIAGPLSFCYYPDDRVIPPLREGDKQMAEQETTGIGWFIAGLGLGALLGILFAPKAGKELREGFMTSAKDKKDYVTARSREAREQINSVVDRGREQVNEFAERGKEAAEKGRERWSGIVDRVSGSRSEVEPHAHDDEEPFHGGAAENRF
jgi:gas vesicle protein